MEIEKANGLIWEVTFWEFFFVTGDGVLITYMVLLAAATRFIHFALFRGTLLSPWYYVVDLIVITVIAFIGKRITRSRQMARQYSFEYDRKGMLSWGRRA